MFSVCLFQEEMKGVDAVGISRSVRDFQAAVDASCASTAASASIPWRRAVAISLADRAGTDRQYESCGIDAEAD